MAALLSIAALALLGSISISQANPIHEVKRSSRHSGSVANCVDYKIPLTVTSENLVLDIPHFKNDFDLVDFLQQSSAKNSGDIFHPVAPTTVNVTEHVYIAATFCSPKKSSNSQRQKTVLVTSSGLAYDSRYWDSEYNPSKYSFVETAVAQGYSVFNYDRLGVGKSQKGGSISGYTNQASNQVEILASLVQLVREGKVTGAIGKAHSVVAVGHSFGSHITNILITRYPSLVDAAVLTGDAYDTTPYAGGLLEETVTARIASQLDSRFRELDTGYITSVDIYGHINLFFKAPDYEVKAVEYAYSTVQPFGLLEFISVAAYDSKAPGFKGPILLTAGQYDVPACLGDCIDTYKTQNLTDLFPKSRLISTYILPGSGHGLNFVLNVQDYYKETFEFLKKAGF